MFTTITDPIEYLKTLELKELERLVERVAIEDDPQIDTLNEGQRAAFDFVQQWYEDFFDDDENAAEMVIINGPAGAGKTYLITKIIHAFLHERPGLNIAMVGLTHKATNVARLMSPFLPPPDYKDYPDKDYSNLVKNITRIRYSTVHSILALVPNTINRKQVFVPHPKYGDDPPILQYDICFVDECSMEDQNIVEQLYRWSDDVLIIHVGDKEQLPPVAEKDISPLFKRAVQREIGIQEISLTEVMRQAKGSPILAHATAVRLGKSEQKFNDSLEAADGGSFLCHLNVSDYPNETVEILWRLFNSDHFKRDSNYAKVITWRKEIERKWNLLFRRMAYMDTYGIELAEGKKILPMVVPTERLQLRAPWIESGPAGDEIVFPNSAELVVVEEPEILMDQVTNEYVQFYRVLVEYNDPNRNEKRRSKIDVVHETDEDKLHAIIDRLRGASKDAYDDGDTKTGGRLWGQKIRVETRFADITYPYAGTAHRAQGSTYGYAIPALYDALDLLTPKILRMNPNARAEFKAWKYVALSRAKFGNIIIHKNR